VTEMVSPRRRPDILNGMAIFWILGASSLSLISYLLRDWWKLLLFCNAPGLLFGIAMIWYLEYCVNTLLSYEDITKVILTISIYIYIYSRLAYIYYQT